MRTSPGPADRARSPRRRLRLQPWPVGFSLVAIGVFVFYQYVVPQLSSDARAGVRHWLPLISVNEALVWAICALGLNIVVGYAGLLDLGFVAFWAIGGYTAGWLMSGFFHTQRFHLLSSVAPDRNGIHVSFWLVLIAGAALCALLGIIIGAPTLRLRSDYLALVTLGFGEIIPQVFLRGENVFGLNISNGSRGISPVDPINSLRFTPTGVGYDSLGPFDLTSKYVIFVLLTAITIFGSLRLRDGRLGRAWLAIREDELAAGAMGIPPMRTKLAAYAVGAVAGGVGGVAFATHVNGAFPDRFNFSISITLLAMVVLGGMGNVWGVLLGALMLAWVNSTGLAQAGSAVNDALGTDINFSSYNFLMFGLVLVLMMLFRRNGLLPERRAGDVSRERSVR
ncbi:MAG: branched-chain amino acid ABC transporter permease [Dactylosporangium sp.]|nr:branched-chain amino acid ABC transporter permease [Dactylosporangium sp.]NNJ62879.1 branched-chain amino acid ABC transporter permease [Dactylosporangium sp.]